jgi:hypothetical protein
MTNTGSEIQHTKKRGEWAELRFMARAAEYGLCVAKPWGDSSEYDVAVEYEGGFARVQVKSTGSKWRETGYRCHVCNKRGYTRDAFDFVAAYVVPADVWYIIPAAQVLGKKLVALIPGSEISKYRRYKEAWDLLRVR